MASAKRRGEPNAERWYEGKRKSGFAKHACLHIPPRLYRRFPTRALWPQAGPTPSVQQTDEVGPDALLRGEPVYDNGRAGLLDGANVDGLGTFGALGYLKLHSLSLFQQAGASFGLNPAAMHKDIAPLVGLDEAEAFRVVKPLDRTLSHPAKPLPRVVSIAGRIR